MCVSLSVKMALPGAPDPVLVAACVLDPICAILYDQVAGMNVTAFEHNARMYASGGPAFDVATIVEAVKDQTYAIQLFLVAHATRPLCHHMVWDPDRRQCVTSLPHERQNCKMANIMLGLIIAILLVAFVGGAVRFTHVMAKKVNEKRMFDEEEEDADEKKEEYEPVSNIYVKKEK